MTDRQVPQDTKYRYPRPEHLRTLYVVTVAKDRRVNNYRRHEKDNFPQRPVNNYFRDDRVQLPSRERLLPLPNSNHSVNAPLEGITAGTMSVDRMHVMYCMRCPCLHHGRIAACSALLVCR